ncbi:MAG: fasciclin domain-containing protein [Brevundimonas sp.]|uniref:fasciclin domain-containing protein n=1 Tax=Brevundimonas sp. TaxID=1871086 RepID=UPI0027767155|nr:fasciclin domain-containing protein [Brevundimonas sp.]MDP3400839.1 fasciclin domain-containing protein [Brevundimonas sp.]MDZ4112135.1 fasciclin domain-containing protein [Brevundimonas sp.]
MKFNRIRVMTAVSAVAILGLAACNSEPEATNTDAMEPAATDTMAPAADGTVVAVAQSNPDFSTLVSAVQAAELVDTLNGAGPFTVFAPTNAAFEKIPADTLNGLLQPEQRDALTSVLTYHVVAGQVDAAALIQQIEQGGGSATLTTVQGGTLTARVVDGTVTLTDAAGNTSRVVTADVAASNGIIHAIDTVVMPN